MLEELFKAIDDGDSNKVTKHIKEVLKTGLEYERAYMALYGVVHKYKPILKAVLRDPTEWNKVSGDMLFDLAESFGHKDIQTFLLTLDDEEEIKVRLQ